MGLMKESAKSILRLYSAFISELFNSETKKENFKEYLVDMKDYYKKKMEKKIGFNMGKIKIDLSSEKALKFSYDYIIKELKEVEKNNLPWKKQKDILNQSLMSIGLYYAVSKPIFSLMYSFVAASWNNKEGVITFSDQYIDRVSNKIFQDTKDGIMIHELSHALWYKINNKDESKIKNYKEWSEGFAEYGRIEYFNNLILSNSYGLIKPMGKIYRNGYNKVKKIVERKGLEAYLEIPNRWQEFEKEIQKEK